MNVIKQIVKDGEYGTQTIKMIVKDNERGAQGEKGDKGDAATITAGNAYSIPYTEAPAVMNTGTSSDAVFDFYIPKGERGAQGPQGDKGDRGPAGPAGPSGAAATIAVGTTSTLQPGDNATVTNTGTSANAVFNFGIPKGEKGDDGRDGAIQYTAGTGITISDENVISATGGGGASTWGSITGTLSDQTDLQNALNAKQNALTAGDGITITSDTISADIKPADFFTSTTDTTTGTGTSVTLTDTTTAPFASITPKGDTSQQTYTGKNLLPYPFSSGGSNPRGITFTANSDGSVTLNGQNDGTGQTVYFLFNNSASPMPLSAGTYYFAPPANTAISYLIYDGTYHGFSSSNNYTQTFNADTSVRQIYITVPQGNTTNFNNFKIYPMLTTLSGQTEADYEPYVGGIASPNPDYPQDVKVVTGEQTVMVTGKNMFDKSTVVTGVLNGDGTIGTGNSYRTSDFIPVAPSTAYYKTKSDSARFKYYNKSKTPLTSNYDDLANAGSAQTFTTPADAYYMRLTLHSNDLDTLQIELGSTATTYEPYQGQSYTVNLGSTELCKIGTYQDYIYKSGGNWYKHAVIGKAVLDGTESWSNGSGSFYSLPKSDDKISSLSLENYGNFKAICNYFTKNDFSANIIGQFYSGSSNINFNWDGTHTHLSDFITWMSTHNVNLYDTLATPTDTQITDTDLISQLEALANANSYLGTTHIDTASDGYNLPMILTAEAFTNTLVAMTEVIDGKQNKLTAGSNITITGNTISATDTTYSNMTGASAGSAGASGLVPAPSAGDQDKVLKGDGTWGTVSTGTINDATLTIQQNGNQVATFTANSATNATANITTPVITVTDTDPGEGSALSANNFVAVYGGNVYNPDYSTSEALAGFTWIDGSPVYKKTINFGALPDSTTKQVQHGITNLNRVIKMEGYSYRSADGLTFPLNFSSVVANANSIGTTVTPTYISVDTGMNRNNISECYITLYYTKTS